ncbi:hypothetical protein [Fulvivirga ligni]|uniref:hypothetical protein n=1 Tax=Fulvivirga ligni TaxID=2904246 RepID=UPI001F3BD534|nr:hypothetical protein [Fulvivirga ligni]UII19888.1 hypothetical protein LVD16_18760 [Fulvivirga ligni]
MVLGIIGVPILIYCADELNLSFELILYAVVLLIIPIFIKVELPKMNSLMIDKQGLNIRNIMGRKKHISWDDFNGFKTTAFTANGGSVEEIILYSQGEAILEISSNYVVNYNDIKKILNLQLKYLGYEKFNFFKYVKDRLFR